MFFSGIELVSFLVHDQGNCISLELLINSLSYELRYQKSLIDEWISEQAQHLARDVCIRTFL
jgi:hypothetical protein